MLICKEQHKKINNVDLYDGILKQRSFYTYCKEIKNQVESLQDTQTDNNCSEIKNAIRASKSKNQKLTEKVVQWIAKERIDRFNKAEGFKSLFYKFKQEHDDKIGYQKFRTIYVENGFKISKNAQDTQDALNSEEDSYIEVSNKVARNTPANKVAQAGRVAHDEKVDNSDRLTKTDKDKNKVSKNSEASFPSEILTTSISDLKVKILVANPETNGEANREVNRESDKETNPEFKTYKLYSSPLICSFNNELIGFTTFYDDSEENLILTTLKQLKDSNYFTTYKTLGEQRLYTDNSKEYKDPQYKKLLKNMGVLLCSPDSVSYQYNSKSSVTHSINKDHLVRFIDVHYSSLESFIKACKAFQYFHNFVRLSNIRGKYQTPIEARQQYCAEHNIDFVQIPLYEECKKCYEEWVEACLRYQDTEIMIF